MLTIWFAFLAGLAGSFHCIGMCGGVVAALSVTRGDRPLSARLGTQLFYNLGRITTYALLGGVAGWLGAALDLSALRPFTRWFLFAAHGFVIMVGLGSLFGVGPFGIALLDGRGARWFAAPLRLAAGSGSAWAAYPLGLVLGFIPCGLVYAPLISAAAGAAPLQGALQLAALGLGTLPVLFLFGSATSAISGGLKALMLRLAGLCVALMGAAGLWRALAASCCG
ncbi:cytochrome biogenesis protein [Geomonas silvestris]|uniref:Cytochrome biogenesis protein n=1 Tax=Geomonas silvestris TaxID=2740184 RepID=A0A6V8MEE9_9BACT|nr:sulfite exporter TauE/SafE family protein [Geomonas silvestris]GFO58322.1 cytochrome biogenesis protein [Geomonas silvestris]